jgi:hypothetical protein
MVLRVGLPEEPARTLEVAELQEADALREVTPSGFGVVRTRIVGDEQDPHAYGYCPRQPQFNANSSGPLG